MLKVGEISKNVLGGIDDYLFLWQGAQQQFKYLSNELQPSKNSIENFNSNIEDRIAFFQSKGVKYIHCIFPGKPLVSWDKLPLEFRDISSIFLSHYLESCKILVDKKFILYPLQELVDLNKRKEVFYRHDTHLCDYGSYEMAKYILSHFGFKLIFEDFFIEYRSTVSPDLYRMLGSKLRADARLNRPISDKISYFDNLSYLTGNTNNMVVAHNPEAAQRRILIFGDSFIKKCLIYFMPFFRDLLYVRSEKLQKDIVELFSPDYVITSNVERYLSSVEGDKDSSSSLLSLYGESSYKPSIDFVDALQAQLSFKFHSRVYEKWIKSNPRTTFKMFDFGEYKENSHVYPVDRARNCFRCTGSDPWFEFIDVPLGKNLGGGMKIFIEMESNVNSVAMIFYKSIDDISFTGEKKIEAQVAVGFNLLEFVLPGNLNNSIRFDPLNCPGEIKIINIKSIIL